MGSSASFHYDSRRLPEPALQSSAAGHPAEQGKDGDSYFTPSLFAVVK